MEEASANAPEPVNTPYDDSIFVNKKAPDPVPEGTESPKTADTVEETSDTEKKSISAKNIRKNLFVPLRISLVKSYTTPKITPKTIEYRK